MAWLIIIIILLILGLVVFLGGKHAVFVSDSATQNYKVEVEQWKYNRRSGEKPTPPVSDAHMGTAGHVIGGILIGIAVILFLFSSIVEVSTKNVGVETAFGRPTGSLDNGIHTKWPWVTVTELDAAIQTDSYTKADGNCLQARIGYQIVVCVNASIRWRIQPQKADYLFQNYRGFDNIRDSLVTRELNVAINQAMANYDPLAINDKTGASSSPLVRVAANVLQIMRTDIGQYVEVLSVFLPVVSYSSVVEGEISALQKQVVDTRIATEAIQTNRAQAAANRALAASLKANPNVLESQCLTGVLAAINQDFMGLPAGYTCLGSSDPVVIPATKP